MIGGNKSLKVITLLLIQSSVEVAVVAVWGLFCEHKFEVIVTQALIRITATQTARLTVKNGLEAIQIYQVDFEWCTIPTTV